MKKKQLQKLLLASYTNNVLDPKNVSQIANALKRFELKQYIRAIKNYEKQQGILISLPTISSEKEQKKLQETFPDKKIIYVIDSSLIAGLKIVNNDLVTEYTLKNTLENLARHITNI